MATTLSEVEADLLELASAVETLGSVLEDLLALAWAQGTIRGPQLGEMRVRAKVAHEAGARLREPKP
jgi:hypothetical protein